MMRRVDDLSLSAGRLAGILASTMPEMYQNRANCRDPISRAWNDALKAAIAASSAVDRLGELLHKKTGIPKLDSLALPEMDDCPQDTVCPELPVESQTPDGSESPVRLNQPGFDEIPW